MTTRRLSRVFAVTVAIAGLTADSRAQSQRARQGAQTPAPIPGPIVQPSSTFPLKQVAYIKASNPGERAQFGHAVALSGDGNTLAVGSPAESSGSTGVNGNQADSSSYSSIRRTRRAPCTSLLGPVRPGRFSHT